MSTVTITVRTEDGGDVEVTERSTGMRSYAQADSSFVDGLLTEAASKIRAAYGIDTTPTTEEPA